MTSPSPNQFVTIKKLAKNFDTPGYCVYPENENKKICPYKTMSFSDFNRVLDCQQICGNMACPCVHQVFLYKGQRCVSPSCVGKHRFFLNASETATKEPYTFEFAPPSPSKQKRKRQTCPPRPPTPKKKPKKI